MPQPLLWNRNRRAVQVARHRATRRQLDQRRILLAAHGHRMRAARVEAAAARRAHHAGHFAAQDLARALALDHRVGHRHRRQQRLRVRMPRFAEQRVAVGDLDDAAQVHHRHAVADVAHHREVVRDEQVRQMQPLLQLHQHVDHLRLDRHVERRHRLVADHQAGLERQRARDADALALSAGELVRIPLGHVGQQAHRGQQLRHAVAVLGARLVHAVHGQRLADDVAHLHARIERTVRVLVDHLHAAAKAPAGAVGRGDVLALEQDAARRDRLHAQHRQAGGGLAAAALADQAQRLAALERERHAVDRFHHADRVPEQHAAREREVHLQVFTRSSSSPRG